MIKKSTILIFAVFIWLSFFNKIEAATLRLSPSVGSFILGSTFDVSIILNTQEVPINTVEVELLFPADKLQIANPSLGKSIVEIWATPPSYSNQQGRIYFVGGIPSPGINTSDGIVQSFTFRVISPGEGRVTFGKTNTSVLANDGLGTDVLKQTSPADFKFILPPSQGPEIFSPTHPEQGKWYNDPNPILKWTASSQSQGFSYSIDHNSNSIPDTVVDTNEAEAILSNLESGIWYFHVRERAGSSWSGASHYFLNIDTIPTAAFGIDVSPSRHTSNTSPILRFFTTDSLSGFDYFEIKVVSLKSGPTDSTFFFESSSPYQLSGLRPGRYEVIVRSYDKAGNYRDESAVLNILSLFFQFMNPDGIDFYLFFVPWGIFVPIIFLVIIVVLILIYLTWKKHHIHIKMALKEDFKMLKLFGDKN
ncbi:MAG: hypothetical protein EXS49_01590 [Candidatus Pacebacteria bacterium]|nr:hypothetical protein [Candidatus Paceibacterota bacterium]